MHHWACKNCIVNMCCSKMCSRVENLKYIEENHNFFKKQYLDSFKKTTFDRLIQHVNKTTE